MVEYPPMNPVDWLRFKYCQWDINHWPEGTGSLCRFCGCKTDMDSLGASYRIGPRKHDPIYKPIIKDGAGARS